MKGFIGVTAFVGLTIASFATAVNNFTNPGYISPSHSLSNCHANSCRTVQQEILSSKQAEESQRTSQTPISQHEIDK